jgi:hypothetical protein
MKNHWQTHLYTYAVALTQGDKIKPENLEGTRAKAVKEKGLGMVLLVELDPQHFIATGQTTTPQVVRDKAAGTYRTQLTPAGEQYMIPGTEPEDRPKSAQLSLF